MSSFSLGFFCVLLINNDRRFGFNESGGARQGITYDKASTLSLDPSQFSTSFASWEQFVNDVF